LCLCFALFTQWDAPQRAHDEQNVVRIETGPDRPGFHAGLQQDADGGEDRLVGVSDHVLSDGRTKGVAESMLDPHVGGETLKPATEGAPGPTPATFAIEFNERGVSRAQIALAWLRRNPVVVAPLVGAGKPSHIDEAVASLELDLTDEDARRLEAPYTPRYDFQGISDDAELARISARVGIKPAGA